MCPVIEMKAHPGVVAESDLNLLRTSPGPHDAVHLGGAQFPTHHCSLKLLAYTLSVQPHHRETLLTIKASFVAG